MKTINCIFLNVALSLLFVHSAHSQEYNPESEFPQVDIYNAETGSEPIVNNSKNIVFEESQQVWLGLECKFRKAVRWIYNDDFESKVTPTFSLLDRRTPDFNNPESYIFYSYLELTFDSKLVDHSYLACVAYEDNSLITVVSGIEVPDTGTNFIVWDYISNEAKRKILHQLNQTLQSGNSNDEESSCPLEFAYKDDTSTLSVVYFQWFVPNNTFINKNIRKYVDAVTLENGFRKLTEIERRCTNDNATISDSILNIRPHGDIKFQALLLFAETSTEKRSAKGVFSVLKDSEEDRYFQFLWEDIPIERMYYVTGIPEEVYGGQKINIQARWSPYFFSGGLVVSLQRQNKDPQYNATPLQLPDGNRADLGTMFTNFTMVLEVDDSPVQTVSVHFPIYNSSKWITVEKPVQVKVSEEVLFVDESSIDEVTFTEGDTHGTIVCNATGVPSPKLEFIPPREDIKTEEKHTSTEHWSHITITFTSITENTKGNYTCRAYNILSETKKIITVNVLPKAPDTEYTRNIVIVIVIAIVVFLSVALFLVIRIKAQRKEYQKKTDEAISEFLCGCPKKEKNSSKVVERDADNEYNRDYELSLDLWHLGKELLGQGSFAVVLKGHLLLPTGERIVAIKKIMSPSEIEDFKCALYELKLMTIIGSHPNVLQLVAASTDNIKQREIMLALEYCGNGDLLSFMKKRRALFTNLVKDGEVLPIMTAEERNQNSYANVADSSTFSTAELYKWSFQIANGMSFLESKKVVHGDLSARNLLLTDERLIKISDFGLSRQLTTRDENQEIKIAHDAMPWKWMAIESLKCQKISAKSDIWSYGVTLWEIFSLGEIPYPGFTWGPEFLKRLEDGMRMGQPKYVSKKVYDLMITSWSMDPGERPSFEEVKTLFMPEIEKITANGKTEYDRNSTNANVQKSALEEPSADYMFELDE